MSRPSKNPTGTVPIITDNGTTSTPKAHHPGPCVEEFWTLTNFVKKFDKMKVGDCTNHTTGKPFKCCIFIKDNNLTFVSFHNSIGVLSKEEITKRKDNLKIGRTASGKYCLYEGEETFPQPVDLGIYNNIGNK